MNSLLGRNVAILSFGSQRFLIRWLPELRLIEASIEGKTVRVILRRLIEQIEYITSECMKSLICTPSVQFSLDEGCKNNQLPIDDFLLREDSFMIPLSHINQVADTHALLIMPGGRKVLTEDEVHAKYCAWLSIPATANQFDLFLSYRGGNNDSVFVERMYDRFKLHTARGDGSEVLVFLDKECLQIGKYDVYCFGKYRQ